MTQGHKYAAFFYAESIYLLHTTHTSGRIFTTIERKIELRAGRRRIFTTIWAKTRLRAASNKKTGQAILEKYKDIPLTGNRAHPSYTNQAMNRSIKDLCQLAGINELIRITTYKGNVRKDEVHPKWELVGTHTGRRTFIVHALSMGISPSVVMKWTGHSDYKAMKPYIDIVDSAKDEAMAKFDTLL